MVAHIPPGVGIHGMQMLLNSNFAPSLQDLKNYDPKAYRPEITTLKKLAYKKPYQDNKDKVLSVNELSTWTTKCPLLSDIWKAMKMEIHPYKNYTDAKNYCTYMFTIPFEWAVKNDMLTPIQLAHFKEDQRAMPKFLPRNNDPRNDLCIGWIKFRKNGGHIRVIEIQSSLEFLRFEQGKHFRLMELTTVTSIILYEAVRVWWNAGSRKIEVDDKETLLDADKSFPMDVYSRMLRREGFTLNEEKRIWQFPNKRKQVI